MPYADYNKHLQSNRERQKTSRGMANHTKANRAYRLRNRKRFVAHNALNNALRDGRIVRLPCWECGAEQVEAHHPDYDAPLDVVWLCQSHHKQLHEQAKERK